MPRECSANTARGFSGLHSDGYNHGPIVDLSVSRSIPKGIEQTAEQPFGGGLVAASEKVEVV